MLKLIRFWMGMWILGTLLILVFDIQGPFKYLGLSRMHVFNSYSVDLAQWRFVFTRDRKQELPFMKETGERLKWFLDENIKYRGFFRMAGGQKSFERKIALLDFCRENRDAVSYELHIVHRERKIDFKKSIEINRRDLSESERQACERLAQLNTLVWF